jgi:hypothetical protein
VEARRCVSCEVQTSSTYKKIKAIPVTGRGGPPVGVFPVRCEHHSLIKYKALPVTAFLYVNSIPIVFIIINVIIILG